MNKKRIGIFGGSFEPPHQSHLKIVEYCINQQLVDEVWVIPSFNHTQKKNIVSFEDRIKMCDMMFKKWFFPVKVMDIEKFNYSGTSWNLFEMLEILCGDKCTFSFIIGEDQANNISTWYNYKELVSEVNFIVFGRDESNIVKEDVIFKPLWISYYIEMSGLYHSSTNIRLNIKNNRWDLVESMTNKKICKFIQDKKLYL